MTPREQLQAEVEVEIDNVLGEAPESLSEVARQEIRDEFVLYTGLIFDALSKEELGSQSAFEAFVISTLAQVRMRVHETLASGATRS